MKKQQSVLMAAVEELKMKQHIDKRVGDLRNQVNHHMRKIEKDLVSVLECVRQGAGAGSIAQLPPVTDPKEESRRRLSRRQRKAEREGADGGEDAGDESAAVARDGEGGGKVAGDGEGGGEVAGDGEGGGDVAGDGEEEGKGVDKSLYDMSMDGESSVLAESRNDDDPASGFRSRRRSGRRSSGGSAVPTPVEVPDE